MKRNISKSELRVEKVENGHLVPIDSIEYDESNPRINQYLLATKIRTGKSLIRFNKDEFLQALADTASADTRARSFKSFAESIRYAKKIYNPIGVMPNKGNEGGFRCLRGNTRLAVYHYLRTEYPNESNWGKIPCYIEFQPDELEVTKQRLIDHVNRTRDWNPSCFPEAATNLVTKYGYNKTLEITKSLGYDERYLKTQLKAFDLYRKHEVTLYKKYPDALNQPSQFAIWVTYIENSEIKRVVDSNGGPKTLAKWILERKFPRRLDIRSLPKIFSIPAAKKAFLTGDASNAEQFVREQEALDMDFYNFSDLFMTRCSEWLRKNSKNRDFSRKPETRLLRSIARELNRAIKT